MIRKSLFITVTLASLIVQIASVSIHYSRELIELEMAYEGTQASNPATMIGLEAVSLRNRTMFEPEAFFLKHRFRNIATGVNDMIHDRIEPWPTKTDQKVSLAQQLKDPNLNYLAFWPFHLTYYLPAFKPEWALPLWASTLIFLGGLILGLFFIYLGKVSCTQEGYQ